MPGFTRPDVLVLAAGGILGEAWMSGLLAGLEDSAGVDFRDCDGFVGTSAGAIVAARLAAGRRPRRPQILRDDEPPSDFARAADAAEEDDARDVPAANAWSGAASMARAAARLGVWATAPLVPPLIALATPAGARARALALTRMPSRGLRLGQLRGDMAALGARFDGRLRVCCVDRGTGERVVFGRPGAPPADVADAVVASCSIPGIFRPVIIGGREYVDGGVWSLTNLDAAPAGRETEVLCLNVSLGLPLTTPAGLLRAAAGAAMRVETLALRARGARVHALAPDHDASRAIGTNLLDARRARAALEAGYRQGLQRADGVVASR